jgi:hypothetical protein
MAGSRTACGEEVGIAHEQRLSFSLLCVVGAPGRPVATVVGAASITEVPTSWLQRSCREAMPRLLPYVHAAILPAAPGGTWRHLAAPGGTWRHLAAPGGWAPGAQSACRRRTPRPGPGLRALDRSLVSLYTAKYLMASHSGGGIGGERFTRSGRRRPAYGAG